MIVGFSNHFVAPRRFLCNYTCSVIYSLYNILYEFIFMGRYWLVLGGTGSVWGGTGWYLVELGQ